MSGGGSNVEAVLKAEVAECTRLLNAEGILGYSGHVSARLPGRGAFLIQGFDDSRATLVPDDLLTVDFAGNVLAGPSGKKPPSELYIHAEILRRRDDVNSVAHFHPETATLFTLVDEPKLAPVKNAAARWADGIPTHPVPGHIDSPARGADLAATLDAHHAALIRAHGVVVVAESVKSLLADCVHFEENAEAMYRAAALGAVRPLSTDEMADYTDRFDRARHAEKLWIYYTSRAATAPTSGR